MNNTVNKSSPYFESFGIGPCILNIAYSRNPWAREGEGYVEQHVFSFCIVRSDRYWVPRITLGGLQIAFLNTPVWKFGFVDRAGKRGPRFNDACVDLYFWALQKMGRDHA